MPRLQHWKITFRLDGTGVCFNPYEPIHLDGLVAWAGAFRYPPGELPARDEPVDELPLPLHATSINGVRVFSASALFPDDTDKRGHQYWRKRFRYRRAESGLTAGSVNYTTGATRLYNERLELILCSAMTAWFVGNKKEIARWFRRLKYLGRKRSQGHGRIISIEYERTDEDRTLKWNGVATRYYPHSSGLKLVRPRPPYWNITDRVQCLIPGQCVP